MDEATDFEEKELPGHPRSQVYAIFHDAETARRVAKQLNQIGIEPAGIGFWSEARTQKNWMRQR